MKRIVHFGDTIRCDRCSVIVPAPVRCAFHSIDDTRAYDLCGPCAREVEKETTLHLRTMQVLFERKADHDEPTDR